MTTATMSHDVCKQPPPEDATYSTIKIFNLILNYKIGPETRRKIIAYFAGILDLGVLIRFYFAMAPTLCMLSETRAAQ